jgi:glycosyltransferase involved in cell wall biosynthesis
MPGTRSLTYLCFQATREGQASYAHVHEIIRGLERRGWKVDLVQPKYASKSGKIGAGTRLLECIRLQWQVMFSSKPAALLYVRWHPLVLPVMIWARLLGIPAVLEVNGCHLDAVLAYPWLRPLAWFLKTVGRMSFRSAGALITVTDPLRSWLEGESGGRPVYLIPNGANTELFRPEACSQQEFPWPYVIFVGALARWQGIDTAVTAASKPEWPDEVRLVIVGDGEMRDTVLEAARRNQKIIFQGKRPYKMIPGLISRAIAGLVPMNYGMGRSNLGLSPLKLYETLACGVPAIVSRFPGQAEFVAGNACGLVVPPEDPSSLAAAVRELYENPIQTREMGVRGRFAILAGHSWDHRAASTEEVLRCLVTEDSESRISRKSESLEHP